MTNGLLVPTMDKIKYLLGSDGYTLLGNEGIVSVKNVLMTDVKTLQDVTGASIDVIKKVILAASEEILKYKYQTADTVEPWKRLSSGCANVDQILLGGIPINGISEIYGCSGVGKTQFCLQLALHVQLSDQTKEVIYVSTEDVFPSKRLNELANAYRNKYNVNINFEDHIYIEHIAESVQLQKCLLNRLPHFLSIKNIGLIIIDSIAGIFRSENENPNYVTRSHDFNLICKALNNLQDQYNCGILIVNQVTDNVASGISEPCLGLSWANNVTCRFCLSRDNTSPIRKFEIVFAPDLPPTSCNIIITPEGLLNA